MMESVSLFVSQSVTEPVVQLQKKYCLYRNHFSFLCYLHFVTSAYQFIQHYMQIIKISLFEKPPLWSSGQSSWLQIQISEILGLIPGATRFSEK
jgi:hypothetical protein